MELDTLLNSLPETLTTTEAIQFMESLVKEDASEKKEKLIPDEGQILNEVVEESTSDVPEKNKVYIPGPNALDITPDKDGGVLKEVVREGIGDELPCRGNKIKVHYYGQFLDGTVFDSSRKRKDPFEFDLHRGNVIRSWDIGVATMKKGEIAMLTCKPEYAYGKNGCPPKIPGDCTLVFEIELIDWEKEDLSKAKDGGIVRKILRPGGGTVSPNTAALVHIHITGMYNNKVFEDRDVSFHLGEGAEHGIVRGVERGLEKFKKGEKSKLILKPKYAFGAKGKPEFNIPPYATVEYLVELTNFEKSRDSWELDTIEKLNQAVFFKEKATTYFKTEKYNLALRFYTKSMEYLSSDVGFNDDENKQRQLLLLANRLNLALTYLKTDKHVEAKNECGYALEIDPKNVKAIFRRGQAYLNMKEPESAKPDFETVLKLEPNNKLAANQIKICEQLIREERTKGKEVYLNMFEKFARSDKKKEEIVFKSYPDGLNTIGEWGNKEKHAGGLSLFEIENPDVLLIDEEGTFKNM